MFILVIHLHLASNVKILLASNVVIFLKLLKSCIGKIALTPSALVLHAHSTIWNG